MNPLFFIPYVIGGAILGTFPHWLMDMGLLDMPVFNPPYVGVFLEGYLVNLTGEPSSLMPYRCWDPSLCGIRSSSWIWRNVERKNEKAVEAQKSAISAEDEALLNDLDLEF